jgi:hypothetical protein
MTLDGHLSQFGLPDVLRVIESRQMTGCLIVENGSRRAAIYFSGGQWLLAERIGLGLTLAQQFARAGVISPQQFEQATGLPLASASSLTDVQVIRMLIGARVLTQERLRQWAVEDAVNLLGVMLLWQDGEFFFEEGAVIPQGRVAQPLPVAQLLAQAQRLARPATVQSHVAPLAPDEVIDFADLESDVEQIHLTREQWKLLTAVDGQRTLHDVSQTLQEDELRVMRVAGELAAAGIVVIVGNMEGSGPQRAVMG